MKLDDVYIKLELTTVYGKLAGDPAAPLVLALHGWSEKNGWQTWEPLLAPLAEAGYCVVSVDMPGWGQSAAIDSLPLAGWRAVSIVIDILDGLQKATAVLMGKSWGGGVAVQTAVGHPNRVSGLILTAPALRDLDQLQRLTKPVLLTWAEDDPVIPIAMAEKYVTAVPGLTFLAYPHGGHSAAQANVQDFAPQAVNFLNQIT